MFPRNYSLEWFFTFHEIEDERKGKLPNLAEKNSHDISCGSSIFIFVAICTIRQHNRAINHAVIILKDIDRDEAFENS